MSRIEHVIFLSVISFASWFTLSIVIGAFAGASWIGAQIGFNGVMWLSK